ncbi:pectate lyase superfamily protein [Terrimicrobium sacchariphilum]|uniref:Pectate lyase superfamily protein n=1 Tax=Terrimicrobium sacchariphilum TaxID=690879 RepID=A0A146GBZ6_TERSA|nr:right-handed parallel beta-helix repeat-containing protein [Terrimicrobium sacchariphilum]GAT34890.1 pectate lyase superfamily protein [Terrimicrobium sacchariphilum]
MRLTCIWKWAAGFLVIVTLLASGPAIGAEQAGARVPFVTLEAEKSRTNAERVFMTDPDRWPPTPAAEASGRAYVELKTAKDSVDFVSPISANAIVIRHCVPDSPDGGGAIARLRLSVNGAYRQDIQLTSKYSWLYGDGSPWENGQGNTPTEYSHAYWDEARFFIPGGIRAGEVIRLQKDPGDTAAYCRIDLIDLENVGRPLSQPPGSLSVLDFGVQPDSEDAETTTQGIQACAAAAKAEGKMIWLPPGRYLLNKRIRLDGVGVQGAGMWHTTVCDTMSGIATNWGGMAGFTLRGKGASVRDISMDSLTCTSRKKNWIALVGQAEGWEIRRVWISHTGAAIWIAGTDGVVADCRIRNTYADGININNGQGNTTSNVRVENNHVRGTGDDGLAILCNDNKGNPASTTKVVMRNNTAVAPWWGANCDLAGGSEHIVENNLFSDGPGFVINLPPSFPMKPLSSAIVRNNELIRCGNNLGGQQRGAIWIYPGSTSIRGTFLTGNVIRSSLYRGIHCAGSEIQEIVFRSNRIVAPGQDAIYIAESVKGSGIFIQNSVAELSPGRKPLVNRAAKESYHLEEQGNSWRTGRE